jgi:predicted peroxiredoxin
VKSRSNASDTYTVLSEAYGGESLKRNLVFFNGMNGSKRVARTWKVRKEEVVQDLTEPMKMCKKSGIWRIQIDMKVSELWLCN